mmetsp:Transcript_36491/g.80170  ORF Transcript_36491/g.80170 Transcript_36491/m.80170 type:complete len:325 (-) Transcript_36491:70-1044(-)
MACSASRMAACSWKASLPRRIGSPSASCGLPMQLISAGARRTRWPCGPSRAVMIVSDRSAPLFLAASVSASAAFGSRSASSLRSIRSNCVARAGPWPPSDDEVDDAHSCSTCAAPSMSIGTAMEAPLASEESSALSALMLAPSALPSASASEPAAVFAFGSLSTAVGADAKEFSAIDPELLASVSLSFVAAASEGIAAESSHSASSASVHDCSRAVATCAGSVSTTWKTRSSSARSPCTVTPPGHSSSRRTPLSTSTSSAWSSALSSSGSDVTSGLAVGGSMSLARAAETSLAADGASKTQIVATSSVWAPILVSASAVVADLI